MFPWCWMLLPSSLIYIKEYITLSVILFFFSNKEAVFLVLSIILFCAWHDYVERALTSPPFTAEEQTAPVWLSYCFLSKLPAKHGTHFLIVFMLWNCEVMGCDRIFCGSVLFWPQCSFCFLTVNASIISTGIKTSNNC